jgi:hypothetical protein
MCSDLAEGVSKSLDWIIKFLLPIKVDINQADNIRKSIETSCLFKLICLALIIK